MLFGLTVATVAICSCCSCCFWFTCYVGMDERIRYMMALGADGQGRDSCVFDRTDCQRPLRGLCKIVILAVITPCMYTPSHRVVVFLKCPHTQCFMHGACVVYCRASVVRMREAASGKAVVLACFC